MAPTYVCMYGTGIYIHCIITITVLWHTISWRYRRCR